jgi:hypothetical protein
MDLDHEQFRKLVALAYGGPESGYRDKQAELSRAEADAIVALAGLAVDVDRHEDDDEVSLFDAVAREVYGLAGITGKPVEAPVRAVSDELGAQLDKLAAPLRGKASGQLAFAVGYLLAVVDQELGPAESDFVEKLATALGLDEDRADELASRASELLTED